MSLPIATPARSDSNAPMLSLALVAIACVLSAAAPDARGDFVTYRTTLTVRPEILDSFVTYDEEGNPYPTYDNPASLITPGDRFQLTFTVDTSATMQRTEYTFTPVTYVFAEFYNAIVASEMIALPGNVGTISTQSPFTGLTSGFGSGYAGIGLGFSSGIGFNLSGFPTIRYYYLSFDALVDVSRPGESFGVLVGDLEGRLPRAGLDVGNFSDSLGYGPLDATPFIRVVPAPGSAALLGLGGLLAARRRR